MKFLTINASRLVHERQVGRKISHERCWVVWTGHIYSAILKIKKGLIKLVFSYFQTDECRNLFEIPLIISNQKQPYIGVLTKRCSENMQQIYWRAPIPKCDFNKVAKHWCSPVNLLHIFRTPFRKNTYGGLLLNSGENTWSITKETIEGLSISKHEADTRLVFFTQGWRMKLQLLLQNMRTCFYF